MITDNQLTELFSPSCDPYLAGAAVLLDKSPSEVSQDDRDLVKRVFMHMAARRGLLAGGQHGGAVRGGDAVITDDQITEWREAADERVAELAERMVAAGPKAANVSASELHEVAAFVSDVALVAMPALIAEVRRLREGCDDADPILALDTKRLDWLSADPKRILKTRLSMVIDGLLREDIDRLMQAETLKEASACT